MIEDLECKVCFTVPRPDALDTYGLCIKKGHLTCATCCQDWINVMGKKSHCPFCRESPFELKGDNILANKILRDLANEHMYTCENCNNKFSGLNIVDHEAQCPVGRYMCPLCSCFVSPEDLFAGKHACMPSRLCYSLENQMWDKVLFFDDLFKKDSAIFMIHSEYDVMLCLSHKTTASGLSLNVFWIDHYNFPDPNVLKLRIEAQLCTEAGKLFRQNVGEVHDFDIGDFDQDIEPIPQLFVKMKDLAKWDVYSQKFVCTKCHRKRGHIHIQMDFE